MAEIELVELVIFSLLTLYRMGDECDQYAGALAAAREHPLVSSQLDEQPYGVFHVCVARVLQIRSNLLHC